MRKLRLWPIEARLHSIAPKFSLACIAFFSVMFVSYTARVEAKSEQAANCLAENIYHEARGEPRAAKYVIGMLTLARVSDPNPEWPKVICGAVAQDRQFSWVLDYKLATDKRERQQWEEARSIARDLLKNAWKRYTLPTGWACARWYKRSDGKNVSKASMRFFEKKLFPVGSFGSHTAFQAKNGCKSPLPTQS